MWDAAGRSRRTRRELVNAPFGNFLGGWYRFAAYELRDGYVGPAPGAGYQVYDPWSDYRRRHCGEVVDCAHGALLRLADEADADPAAAASLITTWCGMYGLLGLLPHRAYSVSLAARWEHPGPPISKNQVWPVWRRLVRSSDRWVPLSDYPDGFRDALADPKGKPAFPVASAEQAGRLVPPELCGVGWGQPGVVIRVPLANRAEDDLGIEVPERQSLSATWGRYFPTIPVSERETFAYPNPGEVAFWRLYAEPVDDFLATARRVRDAVRALDKVWFPERPDDETVLESRFLEGQGLNRLHMLSGQMKVALAFDPLTSPIEPALLPAAKDCYQQVWVSPSLLCSVALMALLDRVGSSARCKWCGKEIVPGRASGRYCSGKCYEAGKKAELRRSKAGRPFPVIADRAKRQRSPPSES